MSPKIKVTKLPKSEIEIEVEIESGILDKNRAKALEHFSNSLNIAGFRKGKIPEKIIIERLGEQEILDEAAEISINSSLPDILKEAGVVILGRPSVSIQKLAWGNPFIFKLKAAILPDFKLPDYKKIAKEKLSDKKEDPGTEKASEKEINDVLLQIRKNKAHHDWHKQNPNEADHSKHPDFEKEENLPPLDDELAKSAGNFETLEKLKEKVQENIIQEKKARATEKKRALMMEELLKNTEIELPDVLIESEVDKSIAQVKDDIARMGGKFEDYLTHIKKSEEDLRKDLRKGSEERAKIQLVFNKIAEVEKLEPNKEILENEVKKIIEIYPDAKEENARIYVETQLLNSEVMRLLENQNG